MNGTHSPRSRHPPLTSRDLQPRTCTRGCSSAALWLWSHSSLWRRSCSWRLQNRTSGVHHSRHFVCSSGFGGQLVFVMLLRQQTSTRLSMLLKDTKALHSPWRPIQHRGDSRATCVHASVSAGVFPGAAAGCLHPAPSRKPGIAVCPRCTMQFRNRLLSKRAVVYCCARAHPLTTFTLCRNLYCCHSLFLPPPPPPHALSSIHSKHQSSGVLRKASDDYSDGHTSTEMFR